SVSVVSLARAAIASASSVPKGTSTSSTSATETTVTGSSTTGVKVISGAGTVRTKKGSSPFAFGPTANFAVGATTPACISSAVTVYTAVVQVRASSEGGREP